MHCYERRDDRLDDERGATIAGAESGDGHGWHRAVGAAMNTPMSGAAARLVLRWPRSLLALLLVAGALLVVRLPELAVDVSARTLLGEPHAAVDAWRDTARMFHLPEQLVVTVAAPGGVRNAATRALLEHLQKDIAAVPGVATVNSVLDAPLLRQVHGPLAQLENNRRTLRSADVDYDKARAELIDSPLFREVLISADGRSTALLVSLRATDAGADAASRGATLAALREVLKPYAAQAEVGLSGAAVVADEVARAVASDLVRLPVLVLSVMLLLIAAATRRPPVLEFACGSFAVLTTAGLWQTLFDELGAVPAAALPLVVVLAVLLSFTLRASYKLHVSQTDSHDPHDVLAATVEHALRASLPASGVLLLMAATLSLSPLHPAHQLGVLLLCGLGCAWLAAFGLGPCLLAVARRRPQALSPVPVVVPARWLSIGLASVLAAAAVGGVPRFIHEAGLATYLPRASATRDALRTVEHLYGGTLTFDLVLTLPPVKVATPAPAIVVDSPYREATDDSNHDDTWFTSERVKRVEAVHRWLQAQSGVGRVLSLASLLEVGQQLNDGTPLSPFELNLMYKRLPRAVRQSLIDPFVQPSHDAVRIEVRMKTPPPGMTRAALLSHIERELVARFKLQASDYRLSGAYVVYAHMADLLPPTLVVVGTLSALASLALVILSGRTPRAASRLLTPTLIAALGVMGVAGWHGIHLDILTVAASGVAFALFVQIRTAGRRLVDKPAPQALKDGSAPPPRDPYGSTVTSLGIVSVGAGLATLGSAAFAPTARFGLLCGAIVTLALLASQRVRGLRRPSD
jgi:predicted RND superfamily exporter protein